MNERDLFIAALKKPDVAERAAFLDEACGGDAGLRAQVEALLREHEQLGSFLEAPAPPPVLTVDEELPLREGPGTVLGPYKLLEQIGEGGMGVVYLAEQTQPVRRRVALKVLKPGMDTRQVVARFEAERQALALMDHPHIARVLDAGQTGSGRPYFVMDLVKGLPITEYCDQSQLTPRARLELFVHVCQAVQHAHQKGIIHRDLKPTNVLVTLQDGAPLVKVIDFGIAKALGQQLTDKTLFTGFAQMIGTPLYMAPEQAALSNVDVDTRSDIYSLGVLLYELLTGTTPFDQQRLQQAGYDEMRRILREEEPPRPSTRISTLGQAATTLSTRRQSDPKRLSQLFRGELDWIVMKCLEKDRNRRYETANALAADVQRYLHDEPVQACPPSASYRLRKFARRPKGPVLAACLVVLALVVGIIGTTLALLEARRQREAAEANAERASKAQERAEQGFDKAREAVEHYLTAVTNDPDLRHKHDLHSLRKKLLDAAVPFYEWFTQQNPGEAASEAEHGRAYWRLAAVRSEMGEKEVALKDYECARAIFAKLATDFPTAPQHCRDLAAIHNNLGNLLRDLGQWPAAEQAFRRALELQEKLATDFPTVPQSRQELARSHISLGLLLRDLGQRPAAEPAFRRGLEIQEKLADDFPTVPQYRADLAGSCVNFGSLLRDQGEAEVSSSWFAKAIALLDPLVKQEPRRVMERLFLRNAHWNWARGLDKLGRHTDAVKDWDRALALNARPAAEPLIRSGRAVSLARAGEHARAVAEANALAEAKHVTGDTLYDLACVCALAAAKVTGDPRPRLADQYATRAVELLRQAVAKGYKNAAHMKQDKDLDALRGRQDFTELVAKLESAKEKK
jgi:serine/threonine protein kinase